MTPQKHHVVVLGATPKKERYANQAILLLKEQGYSITPVHPKLSIIEHLNVANTLSEINTSVDTLTLYVGPKGLIKLIDDILLLRPKRVIFNPGTESKDLQQSLSQANIEWLEACTLVLLKTKVF